MADIERTLTVAEMQERIAQLEATLDLYDLNMEGIIERTAQDKIDAAYARGRTDATRYQDLVIAEIVDGVRYKLEAELPEMLKEVANRVFPNQPDYARLIPLPDVQVQKYEHVQAMQTVVATKVKFPSTVVQLPDLPYVPVYKQAEYMECPVETKPGFPGTTFSLNRNIDHEDIARHALLG